MKRPNVLIIVEGGIVQWVYASGPVRIRVVDYDRDSEDETLTYANEEGRDGGKAWRKANREALAECRKQGRKP